MPIRTWIAFDHQLDSWFVDGAGNDQRLALARAMLAYSGVGVVVRPQDVSAVSSAKRVGIGLPDICGTSDVRNRIDALHGVDQALTLPIKVGIECGDLHHGSVWLREFLKDLNYVPRGLIVEPYCREPKCLWEMLNVARDFGCRARWKLPVSDELEYEEFQEIFHDSWLLRSDGLSWNDFISGLAVAAGYGCKGVVVGRAFWLDLVSLREPELAEIAARRIAHIRRNFSGNGESMGHGERLGDGGLDRRRPGRDRIRLGI